MNQPINADFRHTGPRRWCADCNAMRSTYRGRFTIHINPTTGQPCDGSDQRVQKADQPVASTDASA
jgi:hypothetical protein